VTPSWCLFTIFQVDVEQNLCVKYAPVTANDGTWIQTEDVDYIYSRLLWLTVNSVITIAKFISVGSHFVLNGALQLEQSIALTLRALHWINEIIPRGSVFMQQTLGVRFDSPPTSREMECGIVSDCVVYQYTCFDSFTFTTPSHIQCGCHWTTLITCWHLVFCTLLTFLLAFIWDLPDMRCYPVPACRISGHFSLSTSSSGGTG